MSYADKNGKDKPARKQSGAGNGYDAPFRGYINVNLSAEQKKTFVRWADSASVVETLNAQVADGVNLSLKWDTRGQCFLASGTQRREASPNAGLVVTARADEPQKALLRLLYTLAYLSTAERWEQLQPLADPDRW